MNPAPAPKTTQLPSAQFVGFELDGQKCLFHIERIQEIADHETDTAAANLANLNREWHEQEARLLLLFRPYLRMKRMTLQ
jgi:chemotaxis signal transduction protein